MCSACPCPTCAHAAAVIIMDFCDYGSLVRPILKGMFRPVSSSGNDREARVRYRALLRTAKEIAQVCCACACCVCMRARVGVHVPVGSRPWPGGWGVTPPLRYQSRMRC